MHGILRFAIKHQLIDTRLEFRRKSEGLSVYRDGQYCGPGWGFTINDIRTGRIREMPESIDAIDQACRHHDQCFGDQGYFEIGCDLTLTGELVSVITSGSSTPQQRVDAAVMAAYFVVQAVLVDIVVTTAREIRDRIRTTIEQGAQMLEAIERELLRKALPAGF